jgi:stage III sporulation protein AA
MYECFLGILPCELQALCRKLPLDRVYEFRLRVNCPVVVCLAGRGFYLTEQGFSREIEGAVMITRADIESIVHKACNYSVYSVTEQLKQAFITICGGVRIGISGEIVMEKGVVTTIKNVSSLNVRIPHEVKGCSYPAIPYIFTEKAPLKTLIVSPPGAGKTTFLRDLAALISEKYDKLNTLILDERGELAAAHMGENQLYVGLGTDVLTGGTKAFGFENGIRSMRPDVIVTDEIATKSDIEVLALAARSGVVVFASVHARGIDELREKPFFRELVSEQVFDRYVVLAVRESAGAIVGIYDKHLKLLAM